MSQTECQYNCRKRMSEAITDKSIALVFCRLLLVVVTVVTTTSNVAGGSHLQKNIKILLFSLFYSYCPCANINMELQYFYDFAP